MTDSDEERVLALRHLIPATGAGIYLDTAYRGPIPAETAAAMAEADEWELRVGRAGEGREEDFAQRVEEARAVLAALIAADPSDITLTAGADAAEWVIREYRPETHELWFSSARGRGIARRPDSWAAANLSMFVGAVPLDVASMDVEFAYFDADKWLLGPEATGAMWINPAVRSPNWGVPSSIGLSRTAVLGLARSVGWLEMYVGLDWIYERTKALAERLFDGLISNEWVIAVEDREDLAGIVRFSITGWPSDQALEELRRRVFAIVGAESTGDPRDDDWIRASVGWFNTDEEIDRFTDAVAELARHTPETLPRKPTLLVH